MNGATAAATRSGLLKAMRFGTSSPTSEREIGDADDDDGERDRIGVVAKADEDLAQRPGERRAGIGAGEDADQRDAGLRGGEEAGRIVKQPERGARAAHLLLRHVLKPGAAGGKHRQLRHREEAVQDNQKGDDEKVPNGHRIA